MPVAMVQEWAEGGHNTENYDAIVERMDVRENPPEGCIVHTAGALPDGAFRIFDVWEIARALRAVHAGPPDARRQGGGRRQRTRPRPA